MAILILSDDDFLALFDQWVEYAVNLELSGKFVPMAKAVQVVRIGTSFYTYGEALLDAHRPIPAPCMP